jgi:hypothetical protein
MGFEDNHQLSGGFPRTIIGSNAMAIGQSGPVR